MKYPTILLLEDEDVLCQMLQVLILEQYPDADLIRFADGDEAWSELQHRKPDLFMLDNYHFGMCGLKILRRLAEHKSEVPIIFMTCMGETKAEQQTWFRQNTKDLLQQHPLRLKPLAKPYAVEGIRVTIPG